MTVKHLLSKYSLIYEITIISKYHTGIPISASHSLFVKKSLPMFSKIKNKHGYYQPQKKVFMYLPVKGQVIDRFG